MTKKIFSVIIALFLIVFTSSVFAANNEMTDSMNKATNTARNVVGGAENVVENAASAVGTGVKDLGNTFTEGASRVTSNNNSRNDNNYTATRTASTRSMGNDGRILGMSPNTWTWLILSIAAIAIVGLVWYYAMQHQNEYDDDRNS